MDKVDRVEISRYVKLASTDEFTDAEAKLWYATVKKSAPKGILTTIQHNSPDGKSYEGKLVRRCLSDPSSQYGNGLWELIIPISRDLLPEELASISSQWNAVSPAGQYKISTNPSQIDKLSHAISGMDICNDEYQSLCLQLAKIRHDNWVKERVDQGWRYGLMLNLNNKTHPMLRAWDELPDQYRDINSQNPEMLLNFLNNQGYAVVRKQELQSLMSLIRNVMM